jgi:hypothetical protein
MLPPIESFAMHTLSTWLFVLPMLSVWEPSSTQLSVRFCHPVLLQDPGHLAALGGLAWPAPQFFWEALPTGSR